MDFSVPPEKLKVEVKNTDWEYREFFIGFGKSVNIKVF